MSGPPLFCHEGGKFFQIRPLTECRDAEERRKRSRKAEWSGRQTGLTRTQPAPTSHRRCARGGCYRGDAAGMFVDDFVGSIPFTHFDATIVP